MKKKSFKRLLALQLAGVMLLAAGCGSSQAPATSAPTSAAQTAAATNAAAKPAEEAAKPVSKEDLPVITYYSHNASLPSGLVSGDKGDLFAERGFQMEVWAFSDEKTNAILASGDLPDIMMVPRDNMEVLIEEGMLLNLDEYLDQIPHLASNEFVDEALGNIRENFSYGTGGVYGLPGWVGRTGNQFGISAPTDR